MHLVDGTIPIAQCVAYTAISGTAVAIGIKQYYKKTIDRSDFKIMSGVFTAIVFLLTVFEIPNPIGSSEHPTGTPLMALFMGPFVTVFLSAVVMALELLLREGGITTLGANVLSLGVVGGLVGVGVFFLAKKARLSLFWCGFITGVIGDLAVYLMTSSQLSIANGNLKSLVIYFISFLPAQLPIAIIEGIFTGIVLQFIYKRRPEILERFGIWSK